MLQYKNDSVPNNNLKELADAMKNRRSFFVNSRPSIQVSRPQSSSDFDNQDP
jgi:hypothetical protein